MPFPSPGIKPGSAALQADALLSEHPGKPALNVVHNSRGASGTWKGALVRCLVQSRCSVDAECQEREQGAPLTASAGASDCHCLPPDALPWSPRPSGTPALIQTAGLPSEKGNIGRDFPN